MGASEGGQKDPPPLIGSVSQTVSLNYNGQDTRDQDTTHYKKINKLKTTMFSIFSIFKVDLGLCLLF